MAVAVLINAAWAAFSLRHVVGLEHQGEIDVVFGVYDLGTRRVHGLLPAPSGPEEFRLLGTEGCEGAPVRELLGRGE